MNPFEIEIGAGLRHEFEEQKRHDPHVIWKGRRGAKEARFMEHFERCNEHDAHHVEYLVYGFGIFVHYQSIRC